MDEVLRQTLQLSDPRHLLVFFLVLSRVTGLLLTAPMFSSASVPARIKALIVLALTLFVAPLQRPPVEELPPVMLDALVFVGMELVVGMVLGLGIMVLLAGVSLAGAVIGNTAGLSFAETADPTLDENTTILANFLSLLAMAIFLVIGGHRWLMAALLETFHTLPLGSSLDVSNFGESVSLVLWESFQLAVRTAAPATTALLLATLVLGFINRTMPQINILVIGLGLNVMVTLSVLFFALGGMLWIFADQVEPAVQAMFEIIVPRSDSTSI